MDNYINIRKIRQRAVAEEVGFPSYNYEQAFRALSKHIGPPAHDESFRKPWKQEEQESELTFWL